MGKFMKFLYALMLIVLTLLGAAFIAFYLAEETLVDHFLTTIRDPIYMNIILGIGIALILFAIILLVVLIKNSNKGFDVLIEDDKGSVLLTRQSLEAVMTSTINRFLGVKPIKVRAVITDNEKVEARALIDYFGNDDVNTLSEKMREEIITSLSKFTGLTDIRLDLKLDKKEVEERRDGRY